MDTHTKYQTRKHHHFDWLYSKGDKLEYPNSALMLVQTGDGRWFLEQEFGTEYSQFEGVVKSGEDLETMPAFYPDVESAARAAFALMKTVYPAGYEDKSLEEFLADD